MLHVLKGGMALCPEVLWPVPEVLGSLAIHDNAFNGVCLQRLFFEFAALPRAQV